MEQPKNWAALIVRGRTRPEEISEILKLDPDFTHSIPEETGEIWHWQLNSKISDEESPNAHLLALLKKLAPVRKQLQELADHSETIFYCSVELDETQDSVGFVLEPRLLALLGNLGAKLEIHRWKVQGSE
jgi:hypothetical protein